MTPYGALTTKTFLHALARPLGRPLARKVQSIALQETTGPPVLLSVNYVIYCACSLNLRTKMILNKLKLTPGHFPLSLLNLWH